ncbi:MAG: HU family DNA-binding protein [Bacteroidales bacterium]|nr:HU family DNA-binding protein [Candidatus Minthousia equi]
MNNKDFIAELAKASNLTAKEASEMSEGIVQILAEQLCNDSDVNIQSFGSFEVKKKNERVVVSPITRQRMLVPPKLTLSFKPNAAIKDKFK